MADWGSNTRERVYRSSRSGFETQNPSFSSSLLDAIYRSIDQGQEDFMFTREEMRVHQSCRAEKEMANLDRISMIDKWMMEKKENEKSVPARRKLPLRKERGSCSWSSSDSSSGGAGGLFSSTEAESFRFQRPKPVRTNRRDYGDESETEQKRENGLTKTKSRALKIYSELKKVKQPISPGGKLVGILNSLFAGNQKKRSKEDHQNNPSPNTSSTCSSASSLSRSCLSKTTPSHRKPSNNPKRSVRFSPVSVIADENFKSSKQQKNYRVEEAAKEGYLWKNYEQAVHLVEEDEDDDDAASCASSDLFELENLPAIGIKRYKEELPVYETTSFHANRAIAKGLLVL